MRISKLLYKNSAVAETLNAAKRRRLSIQRVNAHMASFISPIERWADNNYAPYELDYLYHQKPGSSEIVAPLHGFQARDVHVDMSHGHVIILLSLSDGGDYPRRQEYYCEVPLPSGLKLQEAYLEIGPYFLSIHLIPKQSVLKRAVTMACRFKMSWQSA